MDEQGGHNSAQEGPNAHAQKHAEDRQPAIQDCNRILLAISCTRICLALLSICRTCWPQHSPDRLATACDKVLTMFHGYRGT